MSKFKIGDRVRFRYDGHIGTVRGYDDEPGQYLVDDPARPGPKQIAGYNCWCEEAEELELVKNYEPTFVLQTADVFTNVDEAIAKAESMPGITWRVVRQD